MPGRAALWFTFLGGPLAWSAHLLTSFPLVPLACERGSTLHLNLVTAATLSVALAAAATGYLALRRLRSGARSTPGPGAGDGEGSREAPRRALFMARVGLWTSLLFAFVIVVEGLPPILQNPCTGVG